ncbi:transporter substrate-binding domain-containing protein [Saccharopolyspora sp. MS10]|uniref:transporter substrate-binding domain-containing protein n=1 Tax=Saccharopolyspora sp. MS10 TaxID=3385973 RepID=UPI00399FB9AC
MRTDVVAAVLVSAIGLAGCSSAESPEPAGRPAPPPPVAPPAPVNPPAPVAPPPPVALDTSPVLEEIQQRGTLLVGVRADAPGFAARDGAGGYRGFDVEIAKLLARGIGLNPDTQVSYRMLPPTLRADALAGGSVDLQVGGIEPGSPGFTAIGPYAITGDGAELYLAVRSGDDVLVERLTEVLDRAVRDGGWQRAYDTTLAPAGVRAHPAPR